MLMREQVSLQLQQQLQGQGQHLYLDQCSIWKFWDQICSRIHDQLIMSPVYGQLWQQVPIQEQGIMRSLIVGHIFHSRMDELEIQNDE